MLASRLPSILAPLSRSEALEAAIIHSVAGRDAAPLLAGIRPFHAPHHCASLAGLVGGGSPPRPGAISLAHNGVLFLDELPEFAPSVLQGIRQPMEAGEVVVTRADGSVRFPARFMLVAARTIADMEQVSKVGRDHLCEAVGFRLREGGA